MRITTFIFLFCAVICLHAQYTIQGKVTDHLGNPVSFASVTISEASTNKTISFKNTDSKGKFTMQIKNAGDYLLKVRNMKFDSYEEKLKVQEGKTDYEIDISLLPKEENSLDEIIVKGKESLANIDGDTITFKIDRFTDKTERNLGDIINKLPGMEVDENGDIKANGKKVDKLLVEGTDFYSDSQKMATQNLSAKAVKDIQLLTDYKEDGKLDDMNASKKTAVNVQLNEEYKNKITGDALLGTGYESKYDFHTNLFKFNKKGNFSFIGDIQNTGESAFTFSDYMGFIGGFSELAEGRGRSFNMSFGSGLFSILNSSNNVEKRTNQVGAININQKLSSHWQLKFLNINNGTQDQSFSAQNRNYYLGQNEQVIDLKRGDNFFTTNKLTLKFTPNDSVLLKYNLQFNYAVNNYRNNIDNRLDGNLQNFYNQNKAHPWSIIQNLNYEFKPKANALMEFGISYNYQYEPSLNRVNSTQSYLGLPVNDQLGYDTEYEINQTSRNLLLFSAYKFTKKKLIYKMEVGGKIVDNNMQSNWQYIESKQLIEPHHYDYDFKFKRNELYSEVSVAKNKDFWQFDLGAIFKYYTINSDLENKFKRFATYPFANITANFSTASRLSLDYRYDENFPNIENYLPQNEYMIESYRNVQVANENINNGTFFRNNNLSLSYNLFNQFSGFFIWVRMGYNKNKNSLTSYSQFEQEYNNIYNIVGPESETWSAQLMTGKKIKIGIPLQFRIRGNYSKTDGFNGYNPINSQFYGSKFDNWSANIGIETQMKPAFNIEVGLRYNESKRVVDNPLVPIQNFSGNTPFIEFRGAYDKSGIKWNTRFEHSRNQNIKLNIWNLDFTYSIPKTQLEFGAIGRNLLNFNNKEQVNVSQTNLYLYETRYTILPGYFMLTGKLKF